jgi:predicted PurR-regulated permease PerM
MARFSKHTDDASQEVALTIKTETYIRITLLVVATIIFFGALHKASHALLLIFTAFFIALALNAPVFWVSKHLPGRTKNNRSVATTVSFLIVVLLIGGFIAAITPPLVKQTRNFVSAAPGLVNDFRSQDSDTGRLIRKYHLEDQVNDASKQLSERLKHVGGSAFSTVQDVGTSLFSLLTILVLTFMMLAEGPRWIAFAKRLLPPRHHERSARIATEMYGVVKGYVNGQVLLAALAALLISPMLFILGISYPVALVVIIFICGLIPMVGHTIGAIIVTLVALFTSFSSAIIILAYYILYQQIENYLVQPRIQANTTNMSPLLVFISVVVGVSFGGLIGGLVAIPVAGCLRIAVLEYLRSQKIINDTEFKEVTTETK